MPRHRKKKITLPAYLSTAQAAMDSRQWDEALAILDRLIEIIPETPLAFYLKAQVLAARGEAQMLYQDLEVTSRALEPGTVSAEAGFTFSQNLAEAQRLLAVQVSLDDVDELKPWNDECHQKLAICLARGKALFQPELNTVLILQNLLQAATPDAAEIAALVMAYRRCGELDQRGPCCPGWLETVVRRRGCLYPSPGIGAGRPGGSGCHAGARRCGASAEIDFRPGSRLARNPNAPVLARPEGISGRRLLEGADIDPTGAFSLAG